ncbi:unnamed protein product [Sphagnum jensenii]
MRSGDGTIPVRTRRIQGAVWTLECLSSSGEWQGSYWGHSQSPQWNNWIIVRPSGSQENWIEVREYRDANNGEWPWMVWSYSKSLRGSDRRAEEYTAESYCKQLGLPNR